MEPYDFYITPEEYELAAQHGVYPKLLEYRIRELGWGKRQAITRPPQKKNTDPSRDYRISKA